MNLLLPPLAGSRSNSLPYSRWLAEVSPEFCWDWPHLAHVRRHLADVTLGTCRRLILSMPPQHGKLIAHDTPVLTPDGWRTHGDLMPGDRAYGSDGMPVEVVGMSPEAAADWEVEFTDGETIRCHGRHEWTVYDRSCHGYQTVETEWLAGQAYWSGGRARFSVDWVPIHGEARELPVDPYTMGAWLGDGSSSKPHLTYAMADAAVSERVGRSYPRTATFTHKTTGVMTAAYGGPVGVGGPLWHGLRAAGVVRNKHIPDAYLVASMDQRRQLLAGLMDTDGYIHHRTRRACFSTSNRRLAEDVATLVRTFGWRATVARFEPHTSTSGITGRKPVYQVTFSPAGPIPCELDRKRTDGFKVCYRRRGIRSVRRCEPAMGKCIQVANPDGLYLVGRGLVPTHNSEGLTVRYPVWRMERARGLRVAVGAYNQTHANRFSRKSRRLARTRLNLSGERKAANEWETAEGGSYVAVGVGAGITGLPVDLLVIDDPVKNREEADSPAHQERVWEWYMDDLTTRLQHNAPVVLVMTRWHEADLAGKILASEDGPNWRYVRLPAVAEEHDPIGREPGEPLCPALHPIEDLEEKRRVMGEGFEGLYQQNPVPRGGLFFRREWFGEADRVPDAKGLRRLRYWDLAATVKNTSAYSSGVLMATDGERFYVEDVLRVRQTPADRNETILRTARVDATRPGFQRTWFEEQPGAAGVETSEALVRKLAGHPCRADRVTGDKQTRAEPFADAARGGLVRVVKGAWVGAYLNELATFPRGQWADQVDSSSGAYNKLARGPAAVSV